MFQLDEYAVEYVVLTACFAWCDDLIFCFSACRPSVSNCLTCVSHPRRWGHWSRDKTPKRWSSDPSVWVCVWTTFVRSIWLYKMLSQLISSWSSLLPLTGCLFSVVDDTAGQNAARSNTTRGTKTCRLHVRNKDFSLGPTYILRHGFSWMSPGILMTKSMSCDLMLLD